MTHRIVLLISLFCYVPMAAAGNTLPSHSASIKAFMDPNTGIFTQAPKKKIQPLARSARLTAKNSITPSIINSPVKGGGKMVRVKGLFNSQFAVRKQANNWKIQCDL